MYHFFVEPHQIGAEEIRIEGADVNHIRNVLRMKPGEEILISSREGGDYFCRVEELEPEYVSAKILEEWENKELPARIHLFQGLPKGDKMELIIQKAVELGAYRVVPVSMKRSVVKLDAKKADAKRTRWNAVSESAAKQAKLALDIANKTLPLFRHVNSESLRKVCEIIRDDIHADAVAITNTDHVLAYVGVGEHNYQNGDDFISPTTRQAMNYGKIIIKNNDEAHRTPEIHSMLVIPLWEKGVVTGTLKIYYCHAHQITSSLQEMAVGLSQIISTQLEVSRAEQLREMANKAELRALQSKINPHFLFNALNAISSSIRLNPDTARQLIFNLSRYLRYNIELKDDEQIDIKKELYQIKDYIAIEQARFGDKLTVIYDIDEEVNCCIPSLLIQPLVENAIVHGIQPCKGKGVVTISVAECGNRVRIAVRDTGHGIDPKVIERVEANEMPGNKIGLLNVHHRVKLLYGEGLHIRRLEPGTEIAFYIPNQRTPVASQATLLL